MLAAALALLLGVQDVKELIDRLGGDFLDEREEARKTLEEKGKAVEPALLEALGHADPRVRRGCLLLLGKLGGEAALPRAAALFKSDEDAGVVDAAFALIRGLGPAAEKELIEALSSPAPEHRRGAAQALGQFKSARAAEPLDRLEENDPDPDVKEEAMNVLLVLGPPAEAALIKRLDHADEGRRVRSYQGLRDSKNPAVLEAVGKRFASELSKECVDLAYDILRAAGAPAVPYFREGLKSAQERAREKAVDGLKALKSAAELEAVGKLFREDASDAVRKASSEYLKALELKAEDVLIAALKSPARLEAIRALGEIGSEKPLPEISKLFREEKDTEARRTAFEYLRRMGAKAEKDLLFALDDADKAHIRVPAIRALGAARSEAAVERLIEFMGGVDAETKEPARDALVRIGPKALAAVEKAVEAGRVRKAAAEQLRELWERESVEALLAAQITDDGQTGWFEGQFRDLEAHGKAKVVPVLLAMLREPAYAWRLSEGKVGDYESLMRELAVMALGELRDPRGLEPLKAALAEQPTGASSSLREEIIVALNKLGESKPLDDVLGQLAKEADAAQKSGRLDLASEFWFSRGLVLNRVGRRADAASDYLKIVEAASKAPDQVDSVANAYYNLACLKSLDGKKAEAVEWLGKAVRGGFNKREWIRRDKDLDGIRDEAGYKALLADDALFQKTER